MYKRILTSGLMLVVGTGMSVADQVISDDLIVDGSVAVGLDAVNGENFGFDTFRLKENNLRIHFDDTSTSASFPNNDWRIVINDSANGGDSYFAVEDSTAGRQVFRVDAGAPANALKVNFRGDVGIGTANPVTELQITDGDSPTMRLEQNGSSGFTAQTWDVAGNEVNFFIRDATHGSKIPFRIFPSAPTDSLVVEGNTGNVGIGLNNPKGNLHISVTNGAPAALVVGPSDTVASSTLHVAGSAYIGGILEIASSRALKENIAPVSADEAMDALHSLQPVHYNYIGQGESQLGFIAEDVPSIVANDRRNALSPMDFTALLTRVVQEQSRRETDLLERVEAQDEIIQTLLDRLEAVEQGIKAGN